MKWIVIILLGIVAYLYASNIILKSTIESDISQIDMLKDVKPCPICEPEIISVPCPPVYEPECPSCYEYEQDCPKCEDCSYYLQDWSLGYDAGKNSCD